MKGKKLPDPIDKGKKVPKDEGKKDEVKKVLQKVMTVRVSLNLNKRHKSNKLNDYVHVLKILTGMVEYTQVEHSNCLEKL